MNERHFTAVRIELNGGVVAINPRDSEPYNHINEVQEAYDAQIKDIDRIKDALGSPSLDPRARKTLEDKLAEASKNADKAKKL